MMTTGLGFASIGSVGRVVMAPYLACQRVAVLGMYRDLGRLDLTHFSSLLGEFVDNLNIPLFLDLLRRVTRALAKHEPRGARKGHYAGDGRQKNCCRHPRWIGVIPLSEHIDIPG